MNVALLFLIANPHLVSPATILEPNMPRVEGRWARVQVTTALVDLPVLGEREARTLAVTLLDVEQQGGALTLREEVCGVESRDPTEMVRTRYPAAFAKALSGVQRSAHLEHGPQGLRWVEPKQASVRGASISEAEPLPKLGTDPRVIDSDGDGQPGLTVEIDGMVSGSVFVVQKGWSALEGQLRADRAEGLIRWSSEQVVVGATHRLLQSAPASRPHPDPKKSFFRMRRVPTDATCADIQSRRQTLLGL